MELTHKNGTVKKTLLLAEFDGRFPGAWLQPPRCCATAGSSAHAFPLGVAVKFLLNHLFPVLYWRKVV